MNACAFEIQSTISATLKGIVKLAKISASPVLKSNFCVRNGRFVNNFQTKQRKITAATTILFSWSSITTAGRCFKIARHRLPFHHRPCPFVPRQRQVGSRLIKDHNHLFPFDRPFHNYSSCSTASGDGMSCSNTKQSGRRVPPAYFQRRQNPDHSYHSWHRSRGQRTRRG